MIDTILIGVCVVSELFAVRCIVDISSSPSSLSRKLLWTVVVLIPILGPLLYVAVPGGDDPNFPQAPGGISRHGLGGSP